MSPKDEEQNASAAQMNKKSAIKMAKAGKKDPVKPAPKAGKKAPTKFNAKLKKAAAEGKIKGKFKEVVENAPVKMMKKSAAKMMKKSAAKMMKKSPNKLYKKKK